ncbi:nuclear transport factor 2 family protein [Caballeronia sp. LZ035]|uniref:nuclear transport factor 2 family protein n=1 Tax=Caballeronia sp. LZ035 TaxID=3038568 RepID=UPI0028602BD3|nr:nuclear transport factor 2 family protein [Caballeronia sp. LZ035]MDR5758812.1 nuclear transport factor 2 family protein [Caballeronia sp. LZ035]
MSNESGASIQMLEAFATAWNAHDADALMSFMTDDCVFDTSAGPHAFGQRHEGRDAVRRSYAAIWETFPDARWNDARHFVDGDRGVSYWTFTGTKADGTRVEARGCDLFQFKGGRIRVKDSYRKNVVQG